MATATKTVKGFKVLCPQCMSEDAAVKIDLNDLRECSCSECDWEGSPADAIKALQEQVKRWRSVEAWTRAAGEFLASEDPAEDLGL